MVGVPGKSKGCHTCRRRRVKCDQGEPSCSRCVKSGRECEGYARGPVFLNRTAEGLIKRQRLEETRPREPTGAQVAVVTNAEYATQASTFGNTSFFNQWQNFNATNLQLTPSMHNLNSLPTSVEGFFLETFLPFNSDGTPICGEWLHRTFKVVDRGEPLEKSLAALAITRIGRENNDLSMVMEGRALYGEALRALQKALWDKDLVVKDQTLAASQALKMFELQESTQNSISSFDSHVQGLVRLLVYRGNYRNTTPLSRAIVHDVRYSAMINAMQYRRRSPLGNAEWRTQTWTNCAEVEEILWDKGFDLAGVTEDLDRLSKSPRDACTAAIVAESFISLLSIGEDLLRWHGWMLQCCSLAVEWSNPLAYSDQPAQPRLPQDGTLIQFGKLRQSFLMLDFWALSIIHGLLFIAIKGRMPQDVPLPASVKLYTPARQMQLVKNVTMMVPYCCRDEHGTNSTTRCILPLRVALYVARMSETPEGKELEETCEAIMEDMATRKGVRHAHEIKRVSGGWADTHLRTDERDGGVGGFYALGATPS